MDSKKRRRGNKLLYYFKVLLYFSIGILFIFLSSSFLLLLFIKIYHKFSVEVDSSESEGYYRYKLTNYNTKTNETIRSFVTIPQYLEPTDYVHYKDSQGRINLISNFGTREYVCSGVCYCEDDEDNEFLNQQRRIDNQLRNRILYVTVGVVGLGYSLYPYGKKLLLSFKEECKRSYDILRHNLFSGGGGDEDTNNSNDDACENPVTQIIDCEEITEQKDILDRFHLLNNDEEDPQNNDIGLGRIFCSGSCVTVEDADEEVFCESKSIAKELNRVTKEELEVIRNGLLSSGYVSSRLKNDPIAIYRSWFALKHLRPFCRNIFDDGDDDDDDDDNRNFLCDVQRSGVDGLDLNNQNYGCYF